MKKLLLGLCLLSTVSFASTVRVTLPYDTVEVISSDYSTGGGDKVVVYLEVLVKLKDGTYAMYTKQTASIGGLFGMGRLTIPDRFIYVIDKTGKVKDKIEVNW